MRLALIVFMSIALAGCAIARKDAEEPVEDLPARRAKAEPVLKPSEALKPPHLELASPVSDRFYMRIIYFQPTVTTQFRLDPTGGATQGTLLSGEDDLGLDGEINQARMEVDMRMAKRHHLRVDFFKLNRFQQRPLTRDIDFGDFQFTAGTMFRSKLEWQVFTMTHTYQFLQFDRFEAGLGLGVSLIQAYAEGGQPGTLNQEKDSKVGIFPTIAGNAAFRISKRWAVTLRGQQFSASPEDFDGTMSDYHMDIQYRWRRNLAVGLGYTQLKSDLKVTNSDQPLLFNLDTTGPELFVRASF